MKTQILEADAIINKVKYALLNTEMTIYVEWDVEIGKNTDTANVNVQIKAVTGSFSIHENRATHKAKTHISFETDGSWLFTTELWTTETTKLLKIQPIIAAINFDKKQVKISYLIDELDHPALLVLNRSNG